MSVYLLELASRFDNVVNIRVVRMKIKQLFAAGALGAAVAVLPQVGAEAAVFTYSVPLEASQEVDPNFSDSQATGSATGTLEGDLSSWVFSYTVNYSGLEGPLADGHLHLGDRGTNGPVVHFLDNIDSFKGTTSGTIIGNWTSDDVLATGMVTPDVVFNRFLAGGYYFNVHSQTFPGGEIRGQVEFDAATAVPEPSFLLGMLAFGAVGTVSRLRSKN